MEATAQPMKAFTASGVLDCLEPDPATIVLEDIATGLAGMRRWRGLGVSIAQHSVQMARAASSEHVAQWCLLHDASEHVLGDLPSPIHHLPELEVFRQWEERITEAIAERFDLALPIPPEVHYLDRAAARLEADEYLPHAAAAAYPYVRPLRGGTFTPLWTPKRARRNYLAECKRLGLDNDLALAA